MQNTLGKLSSFRVWFEKRLDDAIQAAENEQQRNGNGAPVTDIKTVGGGGGGGSGGDDKTGGPSKDDPIPAQIPAQGGGSGGGGGGGAGKVSSSPKARTRRVYNEEPLRSLPDPPYPMSAYSLPQKSAAGIAGRTTSSRKQAELGYSSLPPPLLPPPPRVPYPI